MSRVVVVGSSNTDMTVSLPGLPEAGQTLLGGRFRSGQGGKGANQAVAARRAGANVVLIAAVGDDRLGRDAIEHYRHEGIDTRYITMVPDRSSGVALIFVDQLGENMIGVAPGANELLTPEDIDRLPDSLFTAGDVLLASLEIPVSTAARALFRGRQGGMITILNPAPAPALSGPELHELLSLAEIITPNRSEAQSLARLRPEPDREPDWSECARRLRGLGASVVVITLGAGGCLLFDDVTRTIPAPRVAAVDTVGAGDAFNGALAVAMLEKSASMAARVAWANAAAALAVTKAGAQSALPRRDDIDRLLAQSSILEASSTD
jgi:ribokinase